MSCQGGLFHELISTRISRVHVVVWRQRKRQRWWTRKQLQSFGRQRDDISLKTINVSSGSVSVVYKEDYTLEESFCSFKHWLTLSFKWLDETYVIATTSLQVTGLGGVAGCFLLSSCCWSYFLHQNTCVAVCFTLLIFFLFVGSSAAGRPRLVTKSQEAAFIIFGWFNYLKE